MTRFFYSCLLYILSPLIVIYLYFIRGKKNPDYRQNFSERFALSQNHLPKNAVIFHCASVGEVLAAVPLITAYQKKHQNKKIIVTCNTPTGRQQVIDSFKGHIPVCYLPFDFWDCANRFIKLLKPQQLIILETELWLNMMTTAKRAHCSTIIINARLSRKSLRGYQRVPRLAKAIMDSIDYVASHNHEDVERFISLGLHADRITATGSIKFDINIDTATRKQAEQLKSEFNHRPVWIAGSSHPKEHEKLLYAHQQLLKVCPEALLIIAPRHPEQFDVVANLLTQQAFTFTKRSENSPCTKQVLLANTLGELKMLYGAADIAYIGGSLIDRGGHNPLEAAAFNIGVVTGPSTYNFAHIYPDLFLQQGAICVENKTELASRLISLLDDPHQLKELGSNARRCLDQNQGAIEKSLQILEHNLIKETIL
ncbi:3-deoxy-D-manno-octulosonic-acid transferase [Pseudoalteromonas citrea]|uniref:3-deoxy-D-manno-octulosonic acid transferase n=2 Tax=Pseudoalteromonas citrea TaxID=43655 RepID=A0AAD4ALR4_9GAMM|nr:lipid IV(A) 3-deoxy-D-manno-octulosonic acid transferase [Pseudoalteromonas citrea]KAF7774455.1 3-deoxy-D-manno-octulosonic-acid transferase [Pseudoalteromonas citrea]